MFARQTFARTAIWRAAPLQSLILTSAIFHLMLLAFLVVLSNTILGRQAEIDLYYHYYFNMSLGLVPYRDFVLEYPPLSVPIMLAPRLFFPVGWLTLPNYTIGFWMATTIASFMMSVYALKLAVLLFGDSQKQRLVWIGRLVIFGLLLIAYIPFRYDIFPALCVIAALYYAAAEKPLWSGIWIGLGTLAKLYPALLIPFLIVYFFLNRKQGQAGRMLFGAAASTIVTLIPFSLIVGTSLGNFMAYHGERGIQIESVYGTIIYLGWLVGLVPATTHHDHGSFNIVASWAIQMNSMVMPLLALGLATVMILYVARTLPAWRRNGVRFAAMLPYIFASLLVFILFNKVFSPQYLIWLLPLAIIMRRRVAWSYGISLVLTTIITLFYVGLIQMETLMIVVLAARNLVLFDTLWVTLQPAKRDIVLLKALPVGLKQFLLPNGLRLRRVAA